MNDPQNPYPYSPAPPSALPAPPNAGPLPNIPVNPSSGYHRQGKVARLPQVLREKVNQMIADGFAYSAIVKALGEDGKALNEDNISNWKLGGYQDWVEENRELDDARLREEYTVELVKQTGGITLNEATIKMATAHIRQVLRSSGPAKLCEAIDENPSNYVRLLNALARLTSGAITCKDHRVKEDVRRAEIEKQQQDPDSRAVTDKTIQHAEKILNLR